MDADGLVDPDPRAHGALLVDAARDRVLIWAAELEQGTSSRADRSGSGARTYRELRHDASGVHRLRGSRGSPPREALGMGP